MNPVSPDIETLRGEVERLRSELQDLSWANEKTNEGVRMLYKDLERKNEELKSLDKMKSRFLAVVSHELRTPITIILQAAENLAEGTFGPVSKDQKEWLTHIASSAERLGRLVNDMLDFSRLQSGGVQMQRELIEPGGLTESVVRTMTPLALKKSITLGYQGGVAPQVWGCGPRIEQIVVNLIGNAIKFTPTGGRVDVRAETAGHACRISVSDTGPGIERDQLDKIFAPFVQVNEDPSQANLSSGVGLGLAICKEIADQHHGKIWAESEIGHGSCFILELPIDPRAEVNSRA